MLEDAVVDLDCDVAHLFVSGFGVVALRLDDGRLAIGMFLRLRATRLGLHRGRVLLGLAHRRSFRVDGGSLRRPPLLSARRRVLHRVLLGPGEHGRPLLHRRRLLLSLLREAQHFRLPAPGKLHLLPVSLVRRVQRGDDELLHRHGLFVRAARAPRVLRVLPPVDGGVHPSGATRAEMDVMLSALATVLVLVPEPEHRLPHAGSLLRLPVGL